MYVLDNEWFGVIKLLHSRIRQRFGRQPVLLRCVEAGPERVLVFRSPRYGEIRRNEP